METAGGCCASTIQLGTQKVKNLSITGDCTSLIQCELAATDKSDDQETGFLEKWDAMRIWLEMKKNGFLTPSFCQMPTPKEQCKKRGIDAVQRKLEIRKVKQAKSFNKITEKPSGLFEEFKPGNDCSDGAMATAKQCREKRRFPMIKRKTKIVNVQRLNRFTLIAAPSGLLNKVNPGIITRIRSSEQVFSVIESLVGTDKVGNGTLKSRQMVCMEEKFGENDARECPISLLETGQLGVCSMTANKLSHMRSEYKGEVDDLGIAVIRARNEDNKSEVKSSLSLSMVSENESSFVSNDILLNTLSDSSPFQEDATLASQWLKLLSLDIARRLAALRHSRMRVQDVISTELSFLMEKEFSLRQEDGQLSAAGCPSMDIHQKRWIALFDQMDKALREEAGHLELWHNQVTEMQSHCKKGFHCLISF